MDESPSASAGERILTVTDLTRQVKNLLEQHIGVCWVRGEISNLRPAASGHYYFTLKDSGAQLSAVAFKGNAAGFLPVLQEGRQVLAFGEVSVYEARGSYQLIIRHMMDDGVGRIQQEFERLKKKLSSEGLFDASRKKLLPAIPHRIAFLTSPTGAAVQDFISNLTGKGWRGEILVIPALVQGADAPASLMDGLEIARSISGLELLVMGRGGGSLEDLACFNNESLVREFADFPAPTISAVGHEIDFVLTDFAADHRAETPTAAARHILQGFLDFEQRTQSAAARLLHNMEQELRRLSREKQFLHKRLQGLRPQRILENSAQQLDELSTRMQIAFVNQLLSKQHTLQERFLQLSHKSPAGQLPHLETRFQHAHARLSTAVDHILHQARLKSNSLRDRLFSASLPRTLARGFSVVTDTSGKVVTCASALSRGDVLCNRFVDGEITSRVE